MSPHIQYWGIPSPAEELFTFSFAGNGTGESMLSSGSRMFVLSVEYDDEEADFIPEPYE